MFGMALSLWMIDIHDVILEVQLTLLQVSKSMDPLDVIYAAAKAELSRLAYVEDILYAYLARPSTPPLELIS